MFRKLKSARLNAYISAKSVYYKINNAKSLDFQLKGVYNKNEVKNMKLEQNIYPYDPELEALPFRLRGIGGSGWQGRVERPEGYMWHQVLFCADGEGRLEHDGGTETVKAGCFVYLPKNVPHKYYPVTERWDVRWVSFDGCCDGVLMQLGFSGAAVVHTDDFGEMETIFDKMVDSQRTDILYSGYTCSGLVYQYMLGLRRLFNTDADRSRSRKLSMLMPALKYMYDNYREDISMAFLAQLIGVTPQHFCRIFKSTMNMRPNDFLTGRRLDEAERLLNDSMLSVAEIAENCGFRDAGYFSTVFRRHRGVSPAGFRKVKSQTG